MNVFRYAGIRLVGLLLATLLGWLTIVGSGDGFGDLVDSDDEVDLNGTVAADDGTLLENFFVEAFPEDDLETATDAMTTDSSGTFTLTVPESESLSLRYSRVDYVTLNTRFESYAVNTTVPDISATTSTAAEEIIDAAFGGLEFNLADKAWLAINVVDAGGNEVDGATISTDPDVEGGGTTFCDGTLTGSNVTTAIPVCIPARDGPMYLAYFDVSQTSVDITVTDVTGTITAPVRLGQFTVITAQQ